MFNSRPPTAEELKGQYAIEFGPSSPRLRLTVLDLLIANGATQESAVDVAKGMLAWITEDVEAFQAVIAAAVPAVEELPAVRTEDGDEFGNIDNGYKYL